MKEASGACWVRRAARPTCETKLKLPKKVRSNRYEAQSADFTPHTAFPPTSGSTGDTAKTADWAHHA